MPYPKKYDKLKACPWRLSNPNYSVGSARCLKTDCLAWDDKKGCLLIEPPGG